MTRNPGTKHECKPGGRSRATQKNVAEPTGKELVMAMKAGVARLTPRELHKIRALRRKVIALNTRRYTRNRQMRDSRRIIIDSGATITLLKKHRWLRKLATRLTAIVKTATGDTAKTEAHGPIQIMTRNSKGEHMMLDNIGEGHLLRDVTFNLMSVSQLCNHGCTVVFKPREAYMVTKEGEKIPFSKERGLYFLPTDERKSSRDDSDVFVDNLAAAVPVTDCTTVDHDTHQRDSERKVNQTMRMLRRASYDYHIANSLRLGPNCFVECMHAAAALHTLNRRKGRAKTHHACLTRAQRKAAASRTPTTSARDEADSITGSQKTKKPKTPKSKSHTARVGKILAGKDTTTGPGKETKKKQSEHISPRRSPRLTPADTNTGQASDAKEAKKKSPKLGRDSKGGEEARKRHKPKRDQQQRADDMALKLERKVDKARDLLTSTTAKLKEAVRENLLLRSKEQAEAADRALLRAREWHRIHRKLNHASKEVTDEEYLSGKHARGSIDKSIYNTLPHDTEKYCVVCDQGKFTRRRQSLFQDPNKHVRPGEVFHADVVGPLPASSKGHRYMITFTCAASNYMFIETAEKKSGARGALKRLYEHVEHMKAETKKGHKIHSITRLVTDRGGEFTANLSGSAKSPFNRTCKKLGIKQFFTSAYDSSQNGKAERTNRTVMEGTRVALVDSHFGWAWWPEAAKYSTFVLNRLNRRIPKRRRDDLRTETSGKSNSKGKNRSSAYTRFTGLKSNTQDLVAFGQRGERELPKPKKKKDVLIRSESVRLVGFATDSKGYIVIDRKGNRWITDKVKFSTTRQPIKNDISQKDHDMVEDLINGDRKHLDDDVSTPLKRGTVRGLDDGELRKSADRSDHEVIKFRAPIHHHSEDPDEKFDVARHAKFTDGLTSKQATRALTAFMKARGTLYMHFKPGSMKQGQKNEKKYNDYKFIRTYDEYVDAVKRKLITGSANPSRSEYRSGDAHNDLMRGHLKIGDQLEPASAMFTAARTTRKRQPKTRSRRRAEVHAITKLRRRSHRVMAFIDDAKSPNRKIENFWEKVIGDDSIKNESPNVQNGEAAILQQSSSSSARESTYWLNSGQCDDITTRQRRKHVTLKDMNRQTRQAEANGSASEYMSSLENHVAADAVLGEERTVHEARASQFAMAATEEIVCGKTVPRTDAEAKASPEWESDWKPSLIKEVTALHDMGTWKLVRRTDMLAMQKRTKKLKVVRKIKVTKDGDIDKFKSRMVVQGFSLLPNDEFFDSYSSVIASSNTRMLMYVSAQTGEDLSSADVGNAYLEASLPEDEVVFVEQHADAEIEGYPRSDWVLQLKKCLYGLPQAGRGYQRKYTKLMLDLGFKQVSAEDCLFVLHHPEHGRIMCSNYVDDLICLTSSKYLRDWWRDALKKHFLRVTFSDELDYILGIKINRGVNSEGRRYIEMDHKLAIEKVAQAAGVGDGARRYTSPMDHSAKFQKKKDGEDDDSSYIPPYKYASVLGAIMYLANLTRPDLVTAVNKLSRYVQDPSHAHYRALTRVVTFAYQTRDRFLRYTEAPEEDDPFRLYSASDSSYADCMDTGRSTIGRCHWMGKKCNGLIDWKSSLPKMAAASTTEAELQAAAECIKDAIYHRVLLHDMGYPQIGSTRVLIDNNACISQLNAVKGVVKARHYIVLLRKVQEAVHLGIVHTQRIDSADNVADVFTKALSVLPYWRLTTKIMGDEHSQHAFTEFRKTALKQELRGGSVKPVNAEFRPKWQAEKAAAKEAQKQRRDQELDDRRAQTAALMALAMGVVSRLESGEREKE